MDNELFELCKEVSTRFPEWRDTDCVWYSNAGEVHDKRSVWHKNDVFDKPANVPLYTSDYLLEKLPNHIEKDGYTYDLYVYFKSHSPIAQYLFLREDESKSFMTVTWLVNTPLKALLKLTIALDDAKELK